MSREAEVSSDVSVGGSVKGWCPDAWRPMMAGDGLLVRVKPRLGRLTRDAVAELCAAAVAHGNGLIDLTRRANLQIRGVTEVSWPKLLDRLLSAGLVDAQAERERARNLLIAPDWREGDDSHRLAGELLERLDELPALPGKVGFVIDAGSAPLLAGEPGDFRLERATDGRIMLRADGRQTGVCVERGREIDALIALAAWFVASGGPAVGRMARQVAPLPAWAIGDATLAPSQAPCRPGRWDESVAYGLAFGHIEARTLLRAVYGQAAVRLTPWRVLLVEGDHAAIDDPNLSTDPAAPLLRVDACPGRPACPQASVETRALARRLATHVAGRLHVSGCGKGCARSAPAAVVLTGHAGRYDLSLNTRAGAEPLRAGLTAADLLSHFGAADAP